MLLALSAVHRNALVTALTRSGWPVIGVRGFDEALRRLGESGARGALVDLRDEGKAGLVAVRALSGRTRVLAIVPGRDLKWITDAIDAGATQYLTSPFSAAELAQAVRLIVRAGPIAVRTEEAVMLEGVAASEAIAARLKTGRVSAMLVAATRFAAVNAAFGRDVGDELVGIVGQRVAGAVRDIDGALIARMGGAEFAVLVPTGDGDRIAAEVCRRIDRPFMVAGAFVTVGCRIGLVDSISGENAADLLRRASGALAAARSSEGGRIAAIGTSEVAETLFGATLETDLRSALAANEIEILFQPQLAVSSGKIVGVEALARWRHPEHGEMGADTLFAVAGRSDYLGTLSAHIQARALGIAAAWQAPLDTLRVAINLTGGDIARTDFASEFLALVDASGLARDRLTVEITEGGLIDNLEGAARVFAELRAGGVRVAIDDFGTGYSSLAWLKALPLDYLKIDKGLAQDIGGTPRARIVVRSVIDMARSLGLSVVAEGVETTAQLELLAAEGCQYWQGYLFAGALTVDALRERVAAL